MNNRQMSLYNNLMNLVATNDAFFFKDFVLEDVCYRIFNYRLASYSDFLADDAIEARGVMFQVEGDVAVRCAAWCQHKFWNKDENPFTMNLDYSPSNITGIMHKMDGSLISTYLHDGELRLKTKGSLSSDQAIAAMKWLGKSENQQFHNELLALAYGGRTVNMEYTAPTNRIVVGYAEETLTVLNVRDNETGEYLPLSYFADGYHAIVYNWVEYVDITDTASFVDNIPQMQDKIEGFVIELKSGQKVKVKTIAYLALHHTKDSINTPRRLFECVINETSDDLRSLFADDPVALGMITAMEDKVVHKFDAMIKAVEAFHAENKDMTRKDYAIKGQTVNDGLFSLKMNLFLEKPNDYKAFAIKNMEMFGIHDEEVVPDSE